MSEHPWPHDELAGDFTYAICGSDWTSVETRKVGLGEPRMEPLIVQEIAEVVRWYVSYHGEGKWQPGMDVGTELTLYAVLRLTSGQWAAVVAGNDYTGWGCQDHAEVRVGETEDDVVKHGLDSEGRALLGYAGGAS